jgi:hypothetical protein
MKTGENALVKAIKGKGTSYHVNQKLVNGYLLHFYILSFGMEMIQKAIETVTELTDCIWSYASQVRADGVGLQVAHRNGESTIESYNMIVEDFQHILDKFEKLHLSKVDIWKKIYGIDDIITEDEKLSWVESKNSIGD